MRSFAAIFSTARRANQPVSTNDNGGSIPGGDGAGSQVTLQFVQSACKDTPSLQQTKRQQYRLSHIMVTKHASGTKRLMHHQLYHTYVARRTLILRHVPISSSPGQLRYILNLGEYSLSAHHHPIRYEVYMHRSPAAQLTNAERSMATSGAPKCNRIACNYMYVRSPRRKFRQFLRP